MAGLIASRARIWLPSFLLPLAKSAKKRYELPEVRERIMREGFKTTVKQCIAWVTREQHRAQARAWRNDIATAFTEHPSDTGETYLQHLWFTSTMAARFLFAMVVLLIHGLFPFLLTQAASKQIESIYGIMKTRIPKSRRDILDMDPGI